MKLHPFLFLLVSGNLLLTLSCRDGEKTTQEPVRIDVQAVSQELADFEALEARLLQQPRLREIFGDHRVNLISYRPDNPSGEEKEDSAALAATNLRFLMYDHTANRSVLVSAGAEKMDIGAVQTLEFQPKPSRREWETAQAALKMRYPPDSVGEVILYPPMPTVITLDNGHRAVTVGVISKNPGIRSGVYAVDMSRTEFIQDIRELFTGIDFDKSESYCEIPGVYDCNVSSASGSVNVYIYQGGSLLWRFRATRPAASSGHPDKGSGIELSQVYYKGKKVLHKAHLPILNVWYNCRQAQTCSCGPYRDWQNEETCFDCTGTDVGSSGFRICTSAPQTFVDDMNDAGNFTGVAVHVHGQEVTLVSELSAGWYRYVTEWTFHADGTIKPRFKFGGTQNGCTCKLHHHHAYWRFDFDVQTISNNTVQERTKNIFGWWSTSKTFTTEGKSFRSVEKCWRVEHPDGICYDIVPGHHDSDGTGDNWAKGDVWVLRYHWNELEDGVGCITCGGMSGSIQDQIFLTGENVSNQDVVVWYRASFDHDAGSTHTGHPEVVGPDLVARGGF